jgi:leader peptidase (prepilin peptidase)/N-methyltransferase
MTEVLAQLPPWARGLLFGWACLVGATVGSFLNVVIARVPAGESIVRPRSKCPRCGKPIAWYDNVPVLSWLVLRARCRTCKAPISVRYPLVELLGAGAAALAWHRHGPSGAAAAEFGFVATLIALAFIDLDTWLLPHLITRPLIGYGLLLSFLGVTAAPSLKLSAYGALLGFSVLFLVAFVGEKVFKKEAMGGGDLWLFSAIGAFEGALALLPVILLASIQGSVVGVVLIVIGRAQPGPTEEQKKEMEKNEEAWVPSRRAIPFGPFLALGALEWLYLPDQITAIAPAFEVFR